MNPIIPPSALDKIVGQTELFNLGMATGLGEEKLLIQTYLTLLKNWPYITSCLYGGVG